MILDENEAKRILEKVQKFSTADSFVMSLNGSNAYNIRFAVNSVTTNGFSDSLSLSITSSFGKKSGSVSLNKFDDESIRKAVKTSEEIAKLSPESKEFMPPVPQQVYPVSNNYSDETDNLSAEKRASYLSYILDEAATKDVITAGFFQNETGFSSMTNSNGLFAYNKNTRAGLSATVRTKDGTGSGRFEKSYVNVNDLEHKSLSDWVINRSILSQNPAEIKPGRYTVILEPPAAADMLALCVAFMSSRPADEGRSFFSKTGGGNKTGEELVSRNALLYSDPTDENAPSIPFDWDGLPRTKIVWFEDGILKNLHRSRYWAEKTGQPEVSYPSNLIMRGSDKSIEQLISETDYAILVTRFWYIRTVEQKTMLVTGLTRDGVFEVKEGRISRPVKNFRFNEAPINVLKNLMDMSRSEKASASENDWMQIYAPALKVSEFNFSSLSDAI